MATAHRQMRSVPRSPAVTKNMGRLAAAPGLAAGLPAAAMPGKATPAGSATTPAGGSHS